jgi:hypothetical protein
MRTFAAFFKAATGHHAYPYHRRLAEAHALPQLLALPTGAGKPGAFVPGPSYLGRPSSVAGRSDGKTAARQCGDGGSDRVGLRLGRRAYVNMGTTSDRETQWRSTTPSMRA